MESHNMDVKDREESKPQRRQFLTAVSTVTMIGGITASYGTLALLAARFLYPASDDTVGWQFVAPVNEFGPGESLEFTTPSGAKVVVARQGEGNSAADFVALSSVCPHLGCQVHWEPANERFFCPCHNGAFDVQGEPTAGPPAAAGQSLSRFPIDIINGLLFIFAPLQSVTGSGQVADLPLAKNSQIACRSISSRSKET